MGKVGQGQASLGCLRNEWDCDTQVKIRFRVLARKTHKWFGLLIGLQVVIWSLTGIYMTAVHIDTIHGDHLVRQPVNATIGAGTLSDPLSLAAKEGATTVRLTWVAGKPIYVAKGPSGERAFSATSAASLARPDERAIRALAASYYAGAGAIVSSRLITDLPGEIRGRKPPLWRVEFDHWNRPTFYLSPVTGELVSRRHELWRVFDFLWMLHIMDYDERENVNNSLLRIFTWGAVLMALSGIWLLFFAFPQRRKARGPAR